MRAEVETGTFASGSVTRLLERLAYRVNATAHSHDERAVHDLRVAIRRFTQSLVVFKNVFSGKEIKKLRRRLKGVMNLTNDIRDCDVAMALLEKSELPAAAALRPQLQDRRKEALRMLLPALSQWTARKTTTRWRAVLTPNGASHDPLKQTARDRVPRIAKKFLKHAEDADSASELHHARIEAKKLRYSLELLQPAYGERFKSAIGQLQEIQTALGKINDCHAVRLVVKDLGGGAEIDAWLKKRQRKKTREFRDQWPATADALRAFLRTFRQPSRKPAAAATDGHAALAAQRQTA
jgi:CHAD domain-containing protein